MKKYIFLFCLFSFNSSFAQVVLKENLTNKVNTYWDFNKLQIQSSGCYYKDEIDETTEKHGKWIYYDRLGEIEEERNYFKDVLHGKVILYHPNKKLKQEGYFNFGKQDSIYREWHENGKLAVEGFYRLDEPVGKWTYYYFDGRTKSEEEVKGGKNYILAFWLPDSLHTQTIFDGTGELSTYHTTGTIREWYNYKNGLKDGPFEEHSINGYVTLNGFFKEGEKDSTWTYAYYTGAKEKISNYRNGKLNGEYTYFYDNGKINVYVFYNDGKKTGRWTWYTNKGTRDMEGDFLEDQQHGDWTYYYPSGDTSYTAHYSKGLKSGLWTYLYKNRNKFKEGAFVDDVKDGLWQTWYEDGTLLMKGVYKKGLEEGEWLNFWDNGKLKNKTTFKAGQMDGEWFSYHENGKLKLSGKYEDNLKVGEWIDYFENGKPKDLISYKIVKEKSKIDYGIMKDRIRKESVRDGLAVSYSQKDYGKTEEGNYLDGKKDGQWIAYYPGGRMPAVVSVYKDGALNGTMKQYDRRGNLLQEMDYKDGVKHGRFVVYDKKGKVLIEKKFDNGIEIIEGTKPGPGGFSPK